MALPTPPPYSNPIPNNPFYSPSVYFIHGPYSPLIVGSGLSVSSTGVITSTGGSGAVSSIVAGTGIGISGPTGNVTITNSGVTSIVAGTGISISGATGAVTINSLTAGTVTAINTGAGLTGGPIITSGTIALATTGITPGTYTNPTISVDGYGRVTSASNGTSIASISGTAPIGVTAGANPVVSISAATTATCGAVLLSDAINSSSSTTAATSLAVKTAYDIANVAIPKSCLTGLGTLLSATGPSTVYTLAPGSNGQILTACGSCTGGLYWSTPSSGTLTSITAGTGLTGGTITTSGTIALNSACIIAPSAITAKGAIITGTAASTPVALPVGTDGQVLTACSTAATGLCWTGIPQACPMTYGIVYGKTNFANTLLGQVAGQVIQNAAGCNITAIGFCAAATLAVPSDSSTAVGSGALANAICSRYNTAIGDRSMTNAASPICENVAVGTLALRTISGCNNTAVGSVAGYDLATGNGNVLIGRNAACANTSGNCNVVIGPNTTTSSLTVSCELVIGYGAGQNWLTGNSTKAIKPGAGIIDCANACGTNGQVLMSNGSNAICWGTATIADATPLAAGKIVGCTIPVSFGLYGITSLGNEAFRCGAAALLNPSTAIGYKAMRLSEGPSNVAIGQYALEGAAGDFGSENIAIGDCALRVAGLGSNNVAIGTCAGSGITLGNFNVALGSCVQVASATGNCQLAIGFSAADNWLTGNSTKAIQPGAGIIDCAASCGTANMVLTSQGNAIQWKTVSSALAVPNYGSYLSTSTQTVGTVSTGQAITLTAVAQNNFTLVGGSQITAAVAGKYNIQISLQILATGGGGGDVEVWFVKNGTAVGNSNTRYSIKNANEEEVAALNFVDTFAAGDNIQVFWASNNSLMTLATLASTMGGPSIPSAIVTIVPVGA